MKLLGLRYKFFKAATSLFYQPRTLMLASTLAFGGLYYHYGLPQMNARFLAEAEPKEQRDPY